MRYEDALRIIENREKTKGYYVRYSYRTKGFEGYGHIPEPYLEEPFGSKEAATAFASKFRQYAPPGFYAIYATEGLLPEDTDA
ncbi:MAG: hypothetical protein WBP49_04100 [Acidimicrobiia bacterium]